MHEPPFDEQNSILYGALNFFSKEKNSLVWTLIILLGKNVKTPLQRVRRESR